MKPIKFSNIAIALDNDEPQFLDGEIFIFICPNCDSTHLVIVVEGRLNVSMAMDAKSAERVADILMNPPPYDGAGR